MYGKGKVSILADRTKINFNIEIDKLSPGSHHIIWVKCTRCKEEFTRSYREISNLHNCPTHIISNGSKLKWCNHCKMFLTFKCFSSNKSRYDGLSSWCNACQGTSDSAIKHSKKQKTQRQTFTSWLGPYLKSKKSHDIKHGIPFDLDEQYLSDLWQTQNGKCFYTGISLEFGVKTPRSAQLDRTDPKGGYIKGNVRWVAGCTNGLKSIYNYSEFVQLLSEIDYSRHLPIRLECKLIHPDAKLPYRGRTTDAGYDVYAVENKIILPREMTAVHTGLCVACPPGWYYTVEGRSGLYQKRIVPNRGIIDATYCGELIIVLSNWSDVSYEVKAGDRIAQIILHKAYHIDVVEVSDFGPDYNQRGTAGFGHSGR
jgi:dUTP pyrophosphatase